MKLLLLTLPLLVLAGCAAAPATTHLADAGTQKCIPRESPIGTNMPSRRCAPVSDEERARAQADAEAMRDDYNRRATQQSLRP